MLKFLGVDEISFPSLLRRACVVEVKSRFVDRDYHQRYCSTHGVDLTEFGVFARDTGAMELLCSGAGVLAGHRMLHDHERAHNKADCY